MSAFVLPNRNIIIPSPDGKRSCRLTKGIMNSVPDWVPETAYFKALVSDGKVVLSTSGKDKDVRRGKAAADKARKAAEEEARKAAADKARKAAEEEARKAAAEAEGAPEEQQDDPGE